MKLRGWTCGPLSDIDTMHTVLFYMVDTFTDYQTALLHELIKLVPQQIDLFRWFMVGASTWIIRAIHKMRHAENYARNAAELRALQDFRKSQKDLAHN